MTDISQKRQHILALLVKYDSLSSSRAHNELLKTGGDLSLVTIKRELSAMTAAGLMIAFGKGGSCTYGIMANALLLAWQCAPLSYRSMEEKDYREAMLVFYKINSILPFKNIFVDQYEFAARNYAVR